MIRLDGVTVTVPPGRTILDDVHVTVARGEWIAVVGPNGAGKTTLLKALSSLVPLARGTIAFDGAGRPRIGMLLQEPDNQLITSSVRHELELAACAGDDRAGAATRVRDASRRFALDDLWERNPHRLSGGEKQRVALATVWLERPDVVLLDEPTAFLDPPMTARCVEFIREMRAAGAAIVWVVSSERDLDYADTVVALDTGAVAFHAPRAQYRVGAGRDAPVVPEPPRRAPAQGASVLEFYGAALRYGPTEVFSGLDLTIRAGECVGVAGNNGSGKSSLLLLAGGVVEPTGGRLVRRYARAASEGRQHVFYLPQSPERMFFAESVLEELAFGLRRLGVSRPEAARRAAEALDAVGLDPRQCLAQPPFLLSPGEMRRVAFAVALVLEPSLLLLDEPTAGLDPDGVRDLYRLIARWRDSGTTVVVASHDARFLEACDRVVTLPDRATRAPANDS